MSKTKEIAYPEPLIIPPLHQPHRQTFIILHGRGSSADEFAPPLLDTPIAPLPQKNSQPARARVINPGIAEGSTAEPPSDAPEAPALNSKSPSLRTAFPHARFVFPTAPRTRATVYRRALTRQWFDNWALDAPLEEQRAGGREDLQLPGLRATTLFLHELIRAEIRECPSGAAGVVLGGLSQGCAASLVAWLLWEGEALGGLVGLCGWLPLERGILEAVEEKEAGRHSAENEADELGFDPFAREESAHDQGDGKTRGSEVSHAQSPMQRAVQWLRAEIGLLPDEEGETFQRTKGSIFLGHGVEDDRVMLHFGREAANCLRDLGAGVEWKEYAGLGHWYSEQMLGDASAFVGRLGAFQI
jgi:predicted esterase